MRRTRAFLIFDCYELLERKHYMNALHSLAQAYEVFFSLFFRVELLYKPFGADPDQQLADLNLLYEALHEKVKDHAFARMRALFLQHIVARPVPRNLAEAAALVAALPDRPEDPGDAAIEGVGDTMLIPHLKKLKATTILTLRNRVVHKQAYRPTREEGGTALDRLAPSCFP